MLLFWIFLSAISTTHAFSFDSVQQWNKSQLVCGYPIKSLKPQDWAEILEEKYENIIGTDSPKNTQSKKFVASYEDFICCLKNVWITVKNEVQKRKCLKLFMKCIKSTQHQKCTLPWTYYANMAVHDLRVATMLVVTSAIFFVTCLILLEKCKEDDSYDSFIGNGF